MSSKNEPKTLLIWELILAVRNFFSLNFLLILNKYFDIFSPPQSIFLFKNKTKMKERIFLKKEIQKGRRLLPIQFFIFKKRRFLIANTYSQYICIFAMSNKKNI
jgi:hypothetical protein